MASAVDQDRPPLIATKRISDPTRTANGAKTAPLPIILIVPITSAPRNPRDARSFNVHCCRLAFDPFIGQQDIRMAALISLEAVSASPYRASVFLLAQESSLSATLARLWESKTADPTGSNLTTPPYRRGVKSDALYGPGRWHEISLGPTTACPR